MIWTSAHGASVQTPLTGHAQCRFHNGRWRNPSHFPTLTPQHHNTTMIILSHPLIITQSYLSHAKFIPFTKAYTRRTLIKSFTKNTSWHFKTTEDNNMIRGDGPVTLVNEKHETQFLRCYIVAQLHKLTWLRALVKPVTQWRHDTGPQSGSVTAVTPRIDDDKVITSTPMPATEHSEGCRQASQTAAAKLWCPTATPERCSANGQQLLTRCQWRHDSEE